tara:strand:- start:266 stop:451 length:186 start_codon:yes stop_codon:yes gene_type:complete
MTTDDTKNRSDMDLDGEGDIEYATEWVEDLLWQVNAGECDTGETFINLRGVVYKILVIPSI